ncbi:MAG: hypothetical protein R2734_04795 [Nocardioides sp.]
MTDVAGAKRADLAGPGIGTYEEVARILPDDYRALLGPRETQRAICGARRFIEDGLCRELGLEMVQVPLIVDAEAGVNDMLDRDGSRTPVSFHISNDNGVHPIDAQVVQAATKWKRVALRQFGMGPGEGLCTDMRAVRKDYFLDHDHSAYVDQWDWERTLTAEDRTLDTLKAAVRGIWSVLRGDAAAPAGALPRPRRRALPRPARGDHLPARRGPPRPLPRPVAQAAGDRSPAGGAGGVHHRHRLDPRRRLSARDARGRLRRLGDSDDGPDGSPGTASTATSWCGTRSPAADTSSAPWVSRSTRPRCASSSSSPASWTGWTCPTTAGSWTARCRCRSAAASASRALSCCCCAGTPERSERHCVAASAEGPRCRPRDPRAGVRSAAARVRPGVGRPAVNWRLS